MRKMLLPIVMVTAVACLSGCATVALYNLDDSNLQVRDQDGVISASSRANTEPCGPAPGGRPSTCLGRFSVSDKAGWLVGLIPVNKPAGDHHLFLDTLIERLRVGADGLRGGDTVINVNVRVQSQITDYLLMLIPFYSSRTVTVTGDVIRWDDES